MSSTSIRKPEFRLLLGYPDVILTRVGVEEPIGTAAPGSERFGPDLRRLAAEVLRARGRLTVVLPSSEVWRGQVEPAGRAPRAEWRAARARAADALGVEPDALATVVGRRSGRGLVPAAAVRRSTLAEVRTLLGSVGLRPAAIIGAGAFEGFAAPPRLAGRWAPPTAGRRRALAGAGGLALAAIALMVMGFGPDAAPVAPAATTPTPAVVATADPAAMSAPPAAVPAVPESVPVVAVAPVRVARADPPPARPATPIVPAAAVAQRMATIGTRDVPIVFTEKKGAPVAELRLAELTDPTGPLVDVAVPLRRPLAAAEPVAPAAAAVLAAVSAMRPEPRPGTAVPRLAPHAVATAPVVLPVGTRAGARPMPRPEAEPVRIASLGDQVSDAVIAASVLTPLARPDDFRAAAPAAKPVAAKPVVAKPAPVKPVAVAPKPAAPAPGIATATLPKVVAPAAPKPVAAPVRQPVVAAAPKPAVQRVVRVEPVRVAAAPAPKPTPVVKPVRVAAAAPTTVRRQNTAAAAGFAARKSTASMDLIGVFGGSDGRKALIRMPNGKIRKVQAGDRVQGYEIAAISSDSVRVSDGRRESVLQMPD